METFTWICQNLNMIFFRFIEILKFQRILISRSQGDRWGSKFGLQTFAAGGHQHYFLLRQGSIYHQFQKMILHVFVFEFQQKERILIIKINISNLSKEHADWAILKFMGSKENSEFFAWKTTFFQRFTSKKCPSEQKCHWAIPRCRSSCEVKFCL